MDVEIIDNPTRRSFSEAVRSMVADNFTETTTKMMAFALAFAMSNQVPTTAISGFDLILVSSHVSNGSPAPHTSHSPQ
ncbi:MAG TPA: hypothetical protein DGB32_00390 [Dehalococcoidia bacterium]|nr:hypothetical protein [Dehalococcoidia bacterium]HCV26762.1 hypothetical protein [Dehalococcoidia bacterium]|tara:strand:- start:275 stop:508 length:234 start_codon:yes stop_codon:yes gene_type:complete